MPKKGVLGNKKRPAETEYPQAEPMKMPERPVTVEVKKAKSGGYVLCKRGGKLGYDGEDHVAESKEKAMDLLEKLLG